jgi:hypothetical protein
LQALKLGVQVVSLSMPAYPPIENQESMIDLANHTFDLRSGDTRFVTDTDGVDLACLDPFAHGQGMKS